MTTKFKKSFSPMLICWNDIKIHLGFEDSYLVPPPIYIKFDSNDKKGNLGNQWQSLISSRTSY